MATYDIWIHPHGRDAVCVDTVTGSKRKGDVKRAMRDAGKVWYPEQTIVADSETAMLVKQGDTVIATIAAEIPEVREHRERKAKA